MGQRQRRAHWRPTWLIFTVQLVHCIKTTFCFALCALSVHVLHSSRWCAPCSLNIRFWICFVYTSYTFWMINALYTAYTCKEMHCTHFRDTCTVHNLWEDRGGNWTLYIFFGGWKLKDVHTVHSAHTWLAQFTEHVCTLTEVNLPVNNGCQMSAHCSGVHTIHEDITVTISFVVYTWKHNAHVHATVPTVQYVLTDVQFTEPLHYRSGVHSLITFISRCTLRTVG
jgi:hypothetical protein